MPATPRRGPRRNRLFRALMRLLRFAGLESLIRVSGFVPASMVEHLQTSTTADNVFESRDRHEFNVVGRLRPGVQLGAARAALKVRADVLARQYPATNAGGSLLVVPETHARPVPQNGPMFHVAAGMLSLLAGLILCITSANIANMLLARAASRGREMALRAALGARTGRIVRPLFTESVVLAILGSAGAVLLAALAVSSMERAIASLSFEVPFRVDFSLDWRVLAVTLLLAVAAGVIAGLAPALYAWRADVNETLARTMWPAVNPIGQRLRLAESDTVVEVIGVVKDGKYILVWEAPRAMLFQPLAQATPASATLEVVTTGPPSDLANAVRIALHPVDPDVPAYRFHTMTDYLEYGQAFLIFRIGAFVAGTFGVLGLILASIGLYGVVGYDIMQRTHEIGVRVALGASAPTSCARW
jgi:hypothetical protein